MVNVKVGNRVLYANEEKAKELVERYKNKGKEIKELSGAPQVVVYVGELLLGVFAANIANEIASELE